MSTPKLKPRRMWVDPDLYAMKGKSANVFSAAKCFPSDLQVAVIPLDDVRELKKIVAKALAKERGYCSECIAHFLPYAEVAMRAIGVLPKARAKKGRK